MLANSLKEPRNGLPPGCRSGRDCVRLGRDERNSVRGAGLLLVGRGQALCGPCELLCQGDESAAQPSVSWVVFGARGP